MISVVVVDLSAESRQRLLGEIGSFLHSDGDALLLLPRVSVAPFSPQELKFHEAPDICILGPELIASAPGEIAAARKVLPHSILVARVPNHLASLSHIEQFARLGVDDVLEDGATAGEFLKKLMLLKGRSPRAKSGTLILVDSGKGGLGATSVTAAFGEVLASSGRSCIAADGDFETHDLTRFLQVKPFVNENLRLILDGQRSLSEDAVSECISPVWDGELPLYCLPPVIESDDLYQPQAGQIRTFMAVLETLDFKYEIVLFDMGCVRGELRRLLYRAADHVVFLVSNDPASLYASVDRVSRIVSSMSPDARLTLLENAPARSGLPNRFLRQEFNRVARIGAEAWSKTTIPFCPHAARWPASGGSLVSQGKPALGAAVRATLAELALIAAEERRGFASIFRRFQASPTPCAPVELRAPGSLPALPGPAAAEAPAPLFAAAELDEPQRLVSGVAFR